MSDREKRTIAESRIEVRAEGDSPPVIVGYAAVFGRRSENLGSDSFPFYEMIEPGAFRQVLKDDVRAVIDHSGGVADSGTNEERDAEDCRGRDWPSIRIRCAGHGRRSGHCDDHQARGHRFLVIRFHRRARWRRMGGPARWRSSADDQGRRHRPAL